MQQALKILVADRKPSVGIIIDKATRQVVENGLQSDELPLGRGDVSQGKDNAVEAIRIVVANRFRIQPQPDGLVGPATGHVRNDVTNLVRIDRRLLQGIAAGNVAVFFTFDIEVEILKLLTFHFPDSVTEQCCCCRIEGLDLSGSVDEEDPFAQGFQGGAMDRFGMKHGLFGLLAFGNVLEGTDQTGCSPIFDDGPARGANPDLAPLGGHEREFKIPGDTFLDTLDDCIRDLATAIRCVERKRHIDSWNEVVIHFMDFAGLFRPGYRVGINIHFPAANTGNGRDLFQQVALAHCKPLLFFGRPKGRLRFTLGAMRLHQT